MRFLYLRRRPIVRETVLSVVIAVCVFIFQFLGWVDAATAWFQGISVPLLTTSTQAVQSISRPYDYLLFARSKSLYLEQLETQHAKALTELTELAVLRKENQKLREMLGSSDRTLATDTVLAAPVVSLAYPAVGVGTTEGVETGDMVLVNRVLVGTIQSVSQQQSRVSLFSQKRGKRVLARTESGVEGVITGNGKNVLLTQIPRSAKIVDGERVVTVGQEGIDRDILLGTIRVIDTDPAAATQTFVVQQLASFYDAVIVEVQ